LNETGAPRRSHGIPCGERPRRRLKNKPFRTALIGLGSNISPERNLTRAVDLLCQYLIVEKVSTAWETPPDGLKGANFLNAAVQVSTQLSPGLLKNLVLRPIEVRLGRVRTANKYAPRTIDLDILVYDGRTLDPKIWSLAFLAVPLAEIIPGYRNPETGEPVEEAAARLVQLTPVRPRPEVLSREA
jgi:2-amino-4-hydroxy-6-hydroxymethyldihydropteridine diphosphokinase